MIVQRFPIFWPKACFIHGVNDVWLYVPFPLIITHTGELSVRPQKCVRIACGSCMARISWDSITFIMLGTTFLGSRVFAVNNMILPVVHLINKNKRRLETIVQKKKKQWRIVYKRAQCSKNMIEALRYIRIGCCFLTDQDWPANNENYINITIVVIFL